MNYQRINPLAATLAINLILLACASTIFAQHTKQPPLHETVSQS